jgi:NifU-like protein
MWDYTKEVMEHFLHPRNMGEIADADAIGEVGNITCGDALKLYLKLDDAKERVVDVKFQTFGCASAIASASALTELVKGKTVAEVEAITNDTIADYLGTLPEEKMHCSVMGMEALEAAISNLRGESDGKVAGHGHDHEDWDPEGLDRTVCACFSVTERQIRNVVNGNGLTTIDQVTHYCKAGGACGGCKDEIQKILDDINGATPQADAEAEEAPALTPFQRMMKINEVVDTTIRPGLQADNGDMEIVDVSGTTVTVRLRGACAGCPGAHVTLKRWVETKLRELVDPAIVVEEA